MSVSTVASQLTFLNSTSSIHKSEDISASSETKETAAISGVNFTISTKWGFKVDEKGFFGADFNKTAGIPENVKIHQVIMQEADAFIQASGKSNIDPLNVVSKVWNLYKTIAGNALDPDGTGFMSPKQMDALPLSYTSKGDVLDGIVAIQYTLLEEAKAVTEDSAHTNPGYRSMAQYGSGTDEEIVKRGRDFYNSIIGNTNDDSLPKDKFSIGELFGEFFNNSVVNETTQYKDPDHDYGASVRNTKIYYETLQNGQGYKAYITAAYGKDALEEIIKYMGTDHDAPISDRKFSQDMSDKFLAEMDKEMKAQYALYQADKYPSLNPSTSKSPDNAVSNQFSQTYQTNKNIKPPTSGSLLNTGA